MKFNFISFCFIFCLFFSQKILAQQLKSNVLFNYPNFGSLEHLTFSGGAFEKGKNITLTPSEMSHMGGFWYAKQKINIKNGFKTEFSFRTTNHGMSWSQDGIRPGADGLALVMHTNPKPEGVGEIGGGMGYTNMPNSLAVEFDIWQNEEVNDNHIAVHSAGAEPNSAEMRTCKAINSQLPFDLKDGKWHKAEISYDTKKILTIKVDGFNIIQKELNLAQIIGVDEQKPFLWFGFTASTGAAYSVHELRNWSMTVFDEQKQEEIKKDTLKNQKTKIQEREIIGKNKVKVQSNTLTIEVWDEGIEDGDIISMFLNDSPIIENYTLKRKKRKIIVNLSQTNNKLVLHAINLGSRPPNTVALTIKDGEKMHKSVLNSNMKTSESLDIIYQPK